MHRSINYKRVLIASFVIMVFHNSLLYADSDCKILGRRQVNKVLDANPVCTALLQVKSVSDYAVAKMVGVNAINASLYMERKKHNGYEQVALSNRKNTSTENIDLASLKKGYYRVCARREALKGNGRIHITFDVVSGKCGTGRDTCFGAIGKNCDGVLGGTCNETTPDGFKICQVAIGSQMHDTCCSANPNGNHCGGNDSLAACKPEWDHAVNDTAATGRNWAVTFNPTIVTYRGSLESKLTESYAQGENYTSKPLKLAFRVPKGTDIWNIDAEQGWCIRPKRYTKSCTPLTNTCWARCN